LQNVADGVEQDGDAEGFKTAEDIGDLAHGRLDDG
jgi:hypothetical protein